tara:strand:- start:3236 stop:3862 length:627 start_codon:yes stop_codon:yes gene_type:complete
MNSKVYTSNHPLIKHSLTILRNIDTDPQTFRNNIKIISTLLTFEATKKINTKETEVNTPMGSTTGNTLSENITLVPVLRAGLGMVEGILDLIPQSSVWHIGLKRDETTLKPIQYYTNQPEKTDNQTCIILDPMLATGGTAVEACNLIKSWGIESIKYVGILAAPEGIECLNNEHPTVDIYVGEIDSHLNDIGFIVPGLGDAGDRQFGT